MSELEEGRYILEEGWHITNDSEALWAVRKVAEAAEDTKRWSAHYKAALERIKQANEGTTAFFKAKLEEYFETMPHRKTKAGQERYDLPNGACLILKPAGKGFERDPEQILEWAVDNAPAAVKATVSLDWAELKKQLSIDKEGKLIFLPTGEYITIPGLSVVDTPVEFTLKMEE